MRQLRYFVSMDGYKSISRIESTSNNIKLVMFCDDKKERIKTLRRYEIKCFRLRISRANNNICDLFAIKL